MATVTELEQRNEDIRTELKDIDAEYAGERMPDEVRDRWNALNEEFEGNVEAAQELKARSDRLVELEDDPRHTEKERQFAPRGRRVSSHVPDDPTQLDEYRNMSSGDEDLGQAYRDGAMQILERRFRPADPYADADATKDNIARLLDAQDLASGEWGKRTLARKIIATSSRGYSKDFATYMRTQGRVVGREMERAASLTTTAGGFAVPVELDTTLILTSAGVINPVRQLARVRQTVANTVEFLSTTGITASYGAEATEASDGAPTLAQPTLNIEKCQAFVPGSIEVFEDWAGIQSDLAMAFRDAKDTVENTKYLTGLGHTSHEPQGLIAVGGATAVLATAATAIALSDIYSLVQGLSPRWRARAVFTGNRATFDKVRQLNQAGSYGAWGEMTASTPATLFGFPVHEWSAYSSAITTQNSTVLTIGDFNQFAIVDRVGMSVEFVPHLFGGSNRYPTGQRGLYAYWRNSSQVLTPGLLANSAFYSLKI